MGKITRPHGRLSDTTAKNGAAEGVKTMNTQGSPLRIGVNPNKGYPASANVSGSKGGMPGYGGANGGNPRAVGNLHKGHAQSGHDAKATARAGSTGYSGKGKC